MRKVLLLLLVAFISGCGRLGFYRPGMDQQAFYNDLRQCEAEVAPSWSWCVGNGCGAQQEQLNKKRNYCMLSRGWQLTRKDPKFVP